MPKVRKQTTVIIGEGPTEFFYLNSLKDEFRQLQSIKPDTPKNTSLRELERSIESAIAIGYDRIFCLIDMDNKKKDPTSWAAYSELKRKYHGKKVHNRKRGSIMKSVSLRLTAALNCSSFIISDIRDKIMPIQKA